MKNLNVFMEKVKAGMKKRKGVVHLDHNVTIKIHSNWPFRIAFAWFVKRKK